MVFLIMHFISVIYAVFINMSRHDRIASFMLLTILVFVLAYLPSLQFGVGTDYFNYVRIFNSPEELELYYRKKEFFFYFLVKFLNYLGFPPQSLFVLTSLISALLLVNILRKLNCEGYRLGILVFCLVIVTNMLHNQMNIIRTYIAVYAIINVFLYKIEGRWIWSAAFSVLAVTSHQTAYLFIPFLFVPKSVYKYIVNHPVFFYLIGSFIYLIGLPFYLIDMLVSYVAPFYSHYLRGDLDSAGLVNLLTRAVYFPFHVIFIFLLLSNRVYLRSNIEIFIVAVWLLTANFYLLFMYWGHFFRIYHYFSFFSIVPVYYVLNYLRTHVVLFILFVSYALLPYIAKVVLFPVGEYKYESFLFSPLAL